LQYSDEQEQCVLGTLQGRLLSFDCFASDANFVEVGHLDSAVLALEQSPDGQLIAILTGSGRFLLMNQYWEVEAENHVQMGFTDGQAVVQDETAEFSQGRAALSWHSDSRRLCTVTQTSEECVPAISGSDQSAGRTLQWPCLRRVM
jgi:hypothetical protein